MATSVTGRCLCGGVRFAVTLPTLWCAHCHCTMCRRAHGAAFVTWFGVPSERVRVTTGAERLVRYRSSDHGTRRFCGTCGSPLFFESTRDPTSTHVPLAAVEGAIDRVPELHVFADDRASWTCLGDGLPRLGGPTGLEPR